MISLNGIAKAFGSQPLLDDVTFSVNRRERIGLVGRNGHGKTTLMRIMTGQEAADAGEIVIPRRYKLGYLKQHIEFTRATALEEACLGLPEEMRNEQWRAEKVLSGLGFTEEDLASPPEIFSGGYQVRLNLARVLISQPDLLLLDEPTNYLDVVSIRWLGRFLSAWPSELILITHDRSFMDTVVTHTVALHRRRAKKIEGDTSKLYEQIIQEEEIYEKTRANDEKKRKEIEKFITRFRAKNTLATRVQSRINYLNRRERMEKLDAIETLEFAFHSAPFPAKLALRADNLSYAWEESDRLFSGLSFEIQSHDRICVIGQNGRGKSTLLRLLAGDLAPDHGNITTHPKLRTGYFAQTNVESLNPHNTVLEEIQSADTGCLPQTARNIAGAMMFDGDNALKRIDILSGGEKSRAMLGKLIVSPCNLLLLDEPTNHLDMDSCDSLLAATDAFEGAVVMVTHNEMFLRALATRFVVFDRGRVIVYDRSYDEFLESIGWEMDDAFGARGGAIARGSSLDKKALRQARAKILQERSRAVGPLEKRVAGLEEKIVALETKAKALLADLEAASVAGKPDTIANLTRAHTMATKRIEELFSKLEADSTALEEQSAEFTRRLDELQG